MQIKKGKKIVFFTRELNNIMGGLEKQMLLIATSLINLGHSVTIISLDEKLPDVFYSQFSKGIEFRNIKSGKPSVTLNTIQRLKRQILVYQDIRQFKYEIGVSFMTGAYWYSRIPTFLCRIPLILAERNAPSIYTLTRVKKIRFFIFLSMIFSTAITVQFSRYKNQYPFFLRKKIKAIPNAVEPILVSRQASSSKIRYVFAGRFSHQKQPMLLLEAFLSFAVNKNDVELVMYGRGDLEIPMEKFITETKSSNLVQILKPKTQPQDFLKDADILCIPSLWEGFPNVLAEALSSGVPALGFRNCDGVTDLLVDRVNGWTCDNDGTIEPLKELLERSYVDLKAKIIFSKNCQKSVELFKKDLIAKNWEDLIFSLV